MKDEVVEVKTMKSFEKCTVLGKELTMYGSLEEPLFLAKDVAEWIEYSKTSNGSYNVAKLLMSVDEDEKIKSLCNVNHFRTTTNSSSKARNTQDMWFLREKGLVQLLSKTRTISNNKKNEIISELQKLGFLKEFKFTAPKEIEFISLLEDVLKPFNIIGEKQFFYKGRRIDYYIPSLKIAIEYDENNHKGYACENQEGRQKMLENELGCRFIRLSDKNSNGYNIGLVLKTLMTTWV